MACGPGCGCPAPPWLSPPVNLGFLPELVAIATVASTADSIVSNHKKKKKAPVYVAPPAPPSILDSFGVQNRGLVLAALGGLGLVAALKFAKGGSDGRR